MVEGLLAGREALFGQRRDRALLLLPLLRDLLDSDGVPELEDSALPVEAPLHGVVDRDDIVRYFGDAIGGVVKGIAEDFSVELAGAVGRLEEHGDPLAGVLYVLCHFERRELRLLPRAVLETLEVEGQDLALVSALDPLVEALPGLFAQELPLDHPRDEIRDAKQIAPLVMRQGSFEVLDHVDQHVEPD